MIDKTIQERQKIFNKVVKHLRKQNCRSEDNVTGKCLYRGPNDTKCAVGVLIPNKEYSSDMEGESIYSIFHKYPSLMKRYGVHIRLLERLQTVHDVHSVDKWEESFQETANDFFLNYYTP